MNVALMRSAAVAVTPEIGTLDIFKSGENSCRLELFSEMGVERSRGENRRYDVNPYVGREFRRVCGIS